MANITVNIQVTEAWPSKEELAARNAVMDKLDRSEFGQFVGAGGGMGTMDFEYKVKNAESAEKILLQVLQETMPGAKYRIHVS